MTLLRLSLSGLLAVSVSGCAFLGSHAETDLICDAQMGQPCTTIADADSGGASRAGVTVAEHPLDSAASELSQDQIVLGGGKGVTRAAMVPDGGAPYFAGRYRLPEQLGALWVAPRFDPYGIFHEANFLHFVLADAAWMTGPAR